MCRWSETAPRSLEEYLKESSAKGPPCRSTQTQFFPFPFPFHTQDTGTTGYPAPTCCYNNTTRPPVSDLAVSSVGGFILIMRQICRSHDPESIMGARVCFCPMRLPSVLLRRTAARTRTSRRKVGRCAKAEVFALLPSEGQPSSLSS